MSDIKFLPQTFFSEIVIIRLHLFIEEKNNNKTITTKSITAGASPTEEKTDCVDAMYSLATCLKSGYKIPAC